MDHGYCKAGSYLHLRRRDRRNNLADTKVNACKPGTAAVNDVGDANIYNIRKYSIRSRSPALLGGFKFDGMGTANVYNVTKSAEREMVGGKR